MEALAAIAPPIIPDMLISSSQVNVIPLPSLFPVPVAWPAIPTPMVPQTVKSSSQPAPLPERSLPRKYVPPQVLKQVLPDARLLRLLVPIAPPSPTRVEIEVTVGPSGEVVDARPTAGGKSSNAILVGAAVTAAKKWSFRPGTINGKAITAGHTIVFDFRPPTDTR
jgi:hypothetical protein